LVEKEKISGLIIEAGCALGGSALILAASKAEGRRMEIYDTFEAIPAPTEADGEFALERYVDIVNGQSVGINGDVYYGYQGDLLPKVISNFTEYGYKPDQTNVFFIKGLYSEQLRISQPVALAHIDCDWYESVMVCLERIEPFMIPGSRLVIDDYGYYAGCTKAVDEYFSLRKTGYQFIQKSRLHIVKC